MEKGNGNFTGTLCIDLKKAFDTVDRQILIAKLERMGFRGPLLGFVTSYLQNRSQYTSVNGINSATLPVEIGVSQGSVL